MKKILKIVFPVIDLCSSPITLLSAIWLKLIRKYNLGFWATKSKISRRIFEHVGVFPIVDHYYEPLFNQKHLKISLRDERDLPGLDLNEAKQLQLLKTLNFSNEINAIAQLPNSPKNYSFNKGPFLSGDAEILYAMVRHFKPKRIIEIGCGHSTLMIQHAIATNKNDDGLECNHVCIEPFENHWLSLLEVNVIKQKVEDMDLQFFSQLAQNDILFIDSSHMIRPQGDVLFEYLRLLPRVNKGVIIHIHDIFTPRDYLDQWIKDGLVFWNEQYLLEAFLSCNSNYEIICAVNYLKHHHYQELKKVAPFISEDREPGSFWIQRL
jgi:predicted O-methyltransferase YrrM